MYKIERFALQNKFLKDQFKALFGESKDELIRSPFARKLAELRNEPMAFITLEELTGTGDAGEMWRETTPVRRLEIAMFRIADHASRAFRDLSAPIIEQYSLEGVDVSDPSQLTERQQASLRFRQVVEQMRQHNVITQFVGYEEFAEKQGVEFVASLEDSHEIWTTSQDGAAIPTITGDTMFAAMRAIIEGEERGELPRVQPDEVLDMLQHNRRRLLAIATHNIREFGDVMDEQLFPRSTVKRVDKAVEENGEQVADYDLEFEGLSNIRAKDSLEIYASVTLGCPALREIHGDRKLLDAQERIAHGSSNYIDHVIAAVLNEAYARGAFNADAYTARVPAPPHPMN
mgnify:CR=1 FL=1